MVFFGKPIFGGGFGFEAGAGAGGFVSVVVLGGGVGSLSEGGASTDFLGRRRIFQKHKPSPKTSAIKAINPTPRPTADDLLRCDVGSPGPPKGAAPWTSTHSPPEHTLPGLQSLVTEHVPTNPSDVLVALGMVNVLVADALDAEIVELSATDEVSTVEDREEDVAEACREEDEAAAVIRVLFMEVGAAFGRRLPAAEDIMIKDCWCGYLEGSGAPVRVD